MTLSTQTRRWVYTGDGITTAFAYNNYIVADGDLEVYLELIASPYTQTLQTLTTHYTVSGEGTDAGGNVTFLSAPANTHKVVIVSKIANTQPSSFQPRRALSNEAIERALDRLGGEVQQLQARLDRTVRLADGDSENLAALPALRSLYGLLLGLDADGDLVGITSPDAPVDLTGQALKFLRVNAGETAYELITAATVLAAIGAAGLAEINTFTKRQIWTKGADIASAATLVLGTDGNYFDVTGSTGPITAITVAAGTLFMLQFDSTPALTHHATNLALPGAANLTMAAGDRLIAFAEAADQVRVLAVARASIANARADIGAPGLAVANTFTQRQVWAKGADIASASTLVLGTDGNYFDVTGTTGITAITVPAGTFFMLQFDGALTLTHHATNLALPGENNIVTAAGDRLLAFAEAANQVRVLDYIAAKSIAFAAGNNTLRADVTGDNTAYDIIFDLEAFDISSNYNAATGLFTAPRAGLYFFSASCWVNGGVAHTDAVLSIVTTSQTFTNVTHFPAGNTEFFVQHSGFFNMALGDTAKVQLNVTGGTGTKVMDIPAQPNRTRFTGRFMP